MGVCGGGDTEGPLGARGLQSQEAGSPGVCGSGNRSCGPRNSLPLPEPAGLKPEASCRGCGPCVRRHTRLWTGMGQASGLNTSDQEPLFSAGGSSIRNNHLCRPRDARFCFPGEGTEVPSGGDALGFPQVGGGGASGLCLSWPARGSP